MQTDATRGAGEGNIQHAEPVLGAPHTSGTLHCLSVATSPLCDSLLEYPEEGCAEEVLPEEFEVINLTPASVKCFSQSLHTPQCPFCLLSCSSSLNPSWDLWTQ